jgi:hypothetical protein
MHAGQYVLVKKSALRRLQQFYQDDTDDLAAHLQGPNRIFREFLDCDFKVGIVCRVLDRKEATVMLSVEPYVKYCLNFADLKVLDQNNPEDRAMIAGFILTEPEAVRAATSEIKESQNLGL